MEPLTIMYLNKHMNAKKLSSHMWFFEGFCRSFHPKYTAFIDVGTVPERDSLVRYFLALEYDQDLGGVCGFLGLYFDVEDENEDPKKLEVIYSTNILHRKKS